MVLREMDVTRGDHPDRRGRASGTSSAQILWDVCTLKTLDPGLWTLDSGLWTPESRVQLAMVITPRGRLWVHNIPGGNKDAGVGEDAKEASVTTY